MNGLLVFLLGWLFVGLETGLRQTLTVRLGAPAAPSFVIPLATMIAMCAPAGAALWSCLLLGVALDLTAPQSGASGNLFIIGPNALGLAIACQFVVAVRGLVIRRNPLTVVVLSISAAAIWGIVVTAFLTARSFYDPMITWQASEQLGGRLMSAFLTGGTALAMSFVLLPMAPLLGLPALRQQLTRR